MSTKPFLLTHKDEKYYLNMDFKSYRWFLLFVAFILMKCTKEESTDFTIPDTPSEIQSYFDRFVQEGKARNVDLDLETMQVYAVFEEIGESTGGRCSYTATSPHKVSIDPTYWTEASETEKTFLVFHELGHCALGLDHDDSKDNKGRCMDIMQSGKGLCAESFSDSTYETQLDRLFSKYK